MMKSEKNENISPTDSQTDSPADSQTAKNAGQFLKSAGRFFKGCGRVVKTGFRMLTGFGHGVKATLESLCMIVFLAAVAFAIFWFSGAKEAIFPSQGEIVQDISQAVIDVQNDAQLQTMEAHYEGVAEYRDEKDKLGYYVRYEAKVTGSVAFDQITLERDEENKKVLIHMPQPELNTNITDKEFLFYDKKYNNKNLETQANKLCLEEVEQTIHEEYDLIAYTKDNAEQVMAALTEPYLTQSAYEGYTLEFIWDETAQTTEPDTQSEEETE